MALQDKTWVEVPPWPTVIVPIGSFEQHGPHLPMDTDARIAEAVAEGLAPLIGATVAPVVAYGASGEHQGFPGTISIGTNALARLLVEMVRSLRNWAGRVVFVNAHGGNGAAVAAAVKHLVGEGCDVMWVPCHARGDAHAGRTETSLMLHLAPQRVRQHGAEAGNLTPIVELIPALRASGVRAASPNGVLGDPAGATSREGAELLAEMVADAAARVAADHPDVAVAPRYV